MMIFTIVGTKEDEQMLRELFGNNVRLSQYYDVDDAHNDLAHDAFLRYLDQLAMKLRSGAYNSFLLFILSHGEKVSITVGLPDIIYPRGVY